MEGLEGWKHTGLNHCVGLCDGWQIKSIGMTRTLEQSGRSRERENRTEQKRAGRRRRGTSTGFCSPPNPTFLACPHSLPVAPAVPSHWVLRERGWPDDVTVVSCLPLPASCPVCPTVILRPPARLPSPSSSRSQRPAGLAGSPAPEQSSLSLLLKLDGCFGQRDTIPQPGPPPAASFSIRPDARLVPRSPSLGSCSSPHKLT